MYVCACVRACVFINVYPCSYLPQFVPINKDHSINKINFDNRKHYLQLHLFQGNQLSRVLSCPRRLSA